MIFSVSSISYRPTDLSLIKEFSKNVSFSNSYKLPSQSAIQKPSMSMVKLIPAQLHYFDDQGGSSEFFRINFDPHIIYKGKLVVDFYDKLRYHKSALVDTLIL